MQNEIPPKKITPGITLVPCMLSLDKKSFIPMHRPLGDIDIEANKKLPWTGEEDFALFEMRKKNMKWTLISKEINDKFHNNIIIRSQKQCRERWNNFIDPDLRKKPFSKKEDELIFKYYEKYGSWAKVAKKLKHRNENQVRNRYKALLSKKKPENLEKKGAFCSPANGHNTYGNSAGVDGLVPMSNYLSPTISTILPSMQLDQAMTPLVSEITSLNFQGDISDYFSNSFVLGSPGTSQVYISEAKKYMLPYNDNFGNSSKFENILDNFCDQGFS